MWLVGLWVDGMLTSRLTMLGSGLMDDDIQVGGHCRHPGWQLGASQPGGALFTVKNASYLWLVGVGLMGCWHPGWQLLLVGASRPGCLLWKVDNLYLTGQVELVVELAVHLPVLDRKVLTKPDQRYVTYVDVYSVLQVELKSDLLELFCVESSPQQFDY